MRKFNYPIVALLLLAGCNPATRQATYEVSGQVQIDSQPLTSGMVVFMPDDGQAAKGPIAADGSFKLGTYAADDGAVAGQYKVMVISADREAMQGGKASLERPLQSLIPLRYSSTSTSGLEFEVSPTEPNVVRFDLVSKARP